MQLSPTTQKERLDSLDIIRGFALLGIFLVNVPTFFSPETLQSRYNLVHEGSQGDHALRLLYDLFIQGKFYPMFSFLFGLGFFLFVSRIHEKGLAWKWIYLRRLVVLLIVGLLHLILLWEGDILHMYAVTGTFLMLFYGRKSATIVITAMSLLAIYFWLYLSVLSVPRDVLDQALLSSAFIGQEKINEALAVYQNFSYIEWIPYHLREEVPPVISNEPYVYPNIFAMFLLGLYAGKQGIFQQPSQHIKLINRVRSWSLSLSLPLILSLIAVRLGYFTIDPFDVVIEGFLIASSGITLCLFYLSSLTLLLTHPRWHRLLFPLGYVGRTALSNYLFQTFISFAFFVVLDKYGNVSLTEGLLFCLIVFPLQIILSRAWLSVFQFGPFEWIWRTLTYGRIQPLRHQIKKAVKE